ncbi:MAG: hypothetical protein ACKO4K_08440 [Flavobacteriales bacterium]
MKWFTLFLFPVLLGSCVTTNYVTNIIPITQKHHTIAVLPPKTTIERKVWMSDDRYNELTIQKQLMLQEHLVRSLNRRINEGKCFVEVLDVQATNDIALPEGYHENRISAKELCRALKVDAVVESTIQILEPVSEMTAIFFQQTTGTTLITNSITLTASLVDSLSNAPLWTLNTAKFGTLGSIKKAMQAKVIRRTTRNTPYNIKKNPYRRLYLEYIKGDEIEKENQEAPMRLR